MLNKIVIFSIGIICANGLIGSEQPTNSAKKRIAGQDAPKAPTRPCRHDDFYAKLPKFPTKKSDLRGYDGTEPDSPISREDLADLDRVRLIRPVPLFRLNDIILAKSHL